MNKEEFKKACEEAMQKWKKPFEKHCYVVVRMEHDSVIWPEEYKFKVDNRSIRVLLYLKPYLIIANVALEAIKDVS